jgi:hypothetical protein
MGDMAFAKIVTPLVYDGGMFEVLVTDTAKAQIKALSAGRTTDTDRAKKVAKTLRLLAADPHHPGLHSHRFDSLDARFGLAVWESYIENRTPSAWRMWWYFGPTDRQITVLAIGPHP